MSILRWPVLITLLNFLTVTPTPAAMTFTSDLRADFEFNFLSTGPLGAYATALGIPTDQFLTYEARGLVVFELDNSGTMPTSMPFTSVTGRLNGILPAPIYSISPNVQFIGGQLTDIVYDSMGQITTANVSNLEMRWEILVLAGDPNLERRAFTIDPLPFSGAVTALPFAIGDTISGPQPGPVNVFWDQDLNVAAGIVQSRSLTAVPEPTSLMVVGVAGIPWLNWRRRRALGTRIRTITSS